MHQRWKDVWLDGLTSSAAVALTAALRGRGEGRSGWGATNAISHMVWGRHAARRRECTLRYTGTGLLLNVAACVFWAWCYRFLRRTMARPNSPSTAVLTGVGITAVAYITDYYVVPRLFTPGFDLSLSRRSFPWLYAALAAGLFLPGLL